MWPLLAPSGHQPSIPSRCASSPSGQPASTRSTSAGRYASSSSSSTPSAGAASPSTPSCSRGGSMGGRNPVHTLEVGHKKQPCKAAITAAFRAKGIRRRCSVTAMCINVHKQGEKGSPLRVQSHLGFEVSPRARQPFQAALDQCESAGSTEGGRGCSFSFVFQKKSSQNIIK